MESNDKWLKPGEVASRLGVNPKTVSRWARKGKVKCFTLPSGHRRFREGDIDLMLAAE
jgi:predicted site-specific integrase-resolvase